MLLTSLLFACGAAEDTATAAADSAGDTAGDTADTAVAELYGDQPAEPVPPPVFVATNRDGTTRTEADLLDHRTVMWFYPAASTAG